MQNPGLRDDEAVTSSVLELLLSSGARTAGVQQQEACGWILRRYSGLREAYLELVSESLPPGSPRGRGHGSGSLSPGGTSVTVGSKHTAAICLLSRRRPDRQESPGLVVISKERHQIGGINLKKKKKIGRSP